MTDVMKFGG